MKAYITWSNVGLLCAGLALHASGQQLNTVGQPMKGTAGGPRRETTLPKAHAFPSAPTNANRTTAQGCNLVINGQFEKENVNPLSGSYSNILGSGSIADELFSWHSPNYASPDFYSEHAAFGTSTNPGTAVAGGFTPLTSNPGQPNGAVGVFTYYAGGGPITTADAYGEYVTQTLERPLNGTHSYYASMRAYISSSSQVATRIGLDINLTPPNSNAALYTAGPSSMQSNGVINTQQWNRVSGVFPGTAGAQIITIGNFDHTTRQAVTPTTSPNAAMPNALYAYTYVDSVEVYEIPTAGPNVACTTGSGVGIGEGCEIPGATYVWSPATNLSSTTILRPTATPSVATTYTLTVTLPDGSTYPTSVNVGACPHPCVAPPVPTLTQVEIEGDDCINEAHFIIDNYTLFDPNFSFTFTKGATGNPVFLTGYSYAGHPGVIVKVSGGSAVPGGATFFVTAKATATSTSYCGSTMSYETTADYYCVGIHEARATTAYPNPATESLALPTGAKNATLLNSQGRVVQRLDAASKLDVRSLPAGLYNLRMEQSGKLINQRIEIKH